MFPHTLYTGGIMAIAMAQTIFEWEGSQHDFGDKGADWFWALGILATAAVIAAILFNNILLALVIAAGAGALALQAAKPPHTHRFRVMEDGLAIDENLYYYEDMMHFSALEYVDPKLPPALSIRTRHILAPHILIPVIGHDPLEIYDYIAQHVPEGNHEHSFLDRFFEYLRL